MDPSEFQSEALIRSTFRDDYGLEPAKLEALYSKAKRHQWNAEADVDWAAFDPECDILDPDTQIFSRLRAVRELPEDVQRRLHREAALFTISQVLHGEQAALMVCGQLVSAVPDLDGKFGAAVQVVDEARHTEVFARYLNLHGWHYPIDPDLQAIVSQLLAEPQWEAKCVGMQIILESVALGFFRTGEKIAAEPVFRQFIRRVHEDEARHVAYGVLTLEERIPQLDGEARRKLEDFAYDAIYRIAGRGGRPTFTSQFNALGRAGIDIGTFLPALLAEFSKPEEINFDGLADPVSETLLPNLMRVGLIPERHVLGYLAQGWRIDPAARTIEDIHTFHADTRAARAELAARGKSNAAPA